jgi:hypothetical protein
MEDFYDEISCKMVGSCTNSKRSGVSKIVRIFLKGDEVV